MTRPQSLCKGLAAVKTLPVDLGGWRRPNRLTPDRRSSRRAPMARQSLGNRTRAPYRHSSWRGASPYQRSSYRQRLCDCGFLRNSGHRRVWTCVWPWRFQFVQKGSGNSSHHFAEQASSCIRNPLRGLILTVGFRFRELPSRAWPSFLCSLTVANTASQRNVP